MSLAKTAALEWLATQRESMTSLLQRLVDTDSNSYDKAGVDAVGAVLVAALAEDGIDVERTPIANFGDVLSAQIGPAKGATVLLLGHRDTVFPPGTVASRGFTRDEKKATDLGWRT